MGPGARQTNTVRLAHRPYILAIKAWDVSVLKCKQWELGKHRATSIQHAPDLPGSRASRARVDASR